MSNSLDFLRICENLRLRPKQVAVWRFDVRDWPKQAHDRIQAEPDPNLRVLLNRLSPDELTRWNSYHRVPLRQGQFLVGRAAARSVLGFLSGKPPVIEHVHEKPVFVADPDQSPASEHPHFNISHSGEQVMLAVSLGMEIGLDIEYIDPQRGMDGLAERCFSRKEREAWEHSPDRTAAFHDIWTRKEAYVKAQGKGVGAGHALTEFSVSVSEPQARIQEQDAPGDWFHHPVQCAAGYAAALVAPYGSLEIIYPMGTEPVPPPWRR